MAPNELFILETQLPGRIERMPLLRTVGGPLGTGPSAFEARVKRAQTSFDMQGDPIQTGDRVVIEQGDQSLEVFRASDSLWWTDHSLMKLDLPTQEIQLPESSEAIELAQNYLRERGLDPGSEALPSVTYSKSTTIVGQELQTVRTAVDVNFRFRAREIPIWGPGAKVKVTFSHGGRPAQVVFFWRDYEPADEFVPSDPELALKRFQQLSTYRELRGTAARIRITKVSLGYVALPPREIQRFLIPAYAIDASVATPARSERAVRRYVPAMDRMMAGGRRLPMATSEALRSLF